jgi:Mce-associated membrane protein
MTTSDPDELARAADAEADAAEARAEAARARAAELRRALEDTVVVEDTVVEDTVVEDTVVPPPQAPSRQPTSTLMSTAAVAVTTLVTAGLLAATGYMLWQHHKTAQQRHSAAEFVAAARQDVVNLMSMDYNKSQESVQRVLDGSTGKFRANFDETADEFAKALRDEKIITSASVNDAAIDSMTGDSAVVLISATSRREGKQAPKDQQQPQVWRVVLTLEREGDQIKMSGVEFV